MWNKTRLSSVNLIISVRNGSIESIKKNNCRDIKSFKINSLEKEIKCIQHADDSIFPLEDELSLENELNIGLKFKYDENRMHHFRTS